MFDTREKKERSLGVKLFLKAGRCNSPKCATVRRPSRPGFHGKSKRRRTLSEASFQLNEKQKLRYSYGVRETQMRRVFSKAVKNPGVTGQMMLSLLERRLDNVIYRLGMAPSRSVARQLVGHGHFTVNGRKVTIPSFLVKIGDKISIRPQSASHPLFGDLELTLKKYEPPVWLSLDKEKKVGEIKALPKETEISFDINKVVDYYSK